MILKKCLSTIALTCVSLVAFSQPFIEELPSNPIALSMGNTGVVGEASAYSIYGNSAATVFGEKRFAVGVSYFGWQPENLGINSGSVAGYYQINNKMSILLDVRGSLLKTQEIINEQGVVSGSFQPTDFAVGVGYAYKFMDCLSASVNLRYLSSKIFQKNASAVAGDIGIYFNKNRLSAGLTLNNIGSKLQYENGALDQNMNLSAGVAYEFLNPTSNHQLKGAGKVGYVFLPNNNQGSILAGIGAQYSFKKMLYARAGYSYSDATTYMPQYASVGLGVKLWGVGIDATYLIGTQSASMIKNSFAVGVSYTF